MAENTSAAGEGKIRLIVRADDIGCSHAANLACIKAYREGIVKSVEIMMPCAWVPEAVTLLNENPGLDVGVHLTVTSEWERVKWRPLTHAPSLTDANGFFHPMTAQREGFPPGTGFLECGWKADELERELRAQIELAMKQIRQVTHVSTHMGAPTCSPELRAITDRVVKDYGLEVDLSGVQRAGGLGSDRGYAAREGKLVEIMEKLTPGRWMFVEHPGMDVAEMQAMGHKGYEDVAVDREGVTRAFCSPRVREVVARRGIELLSYGDVKRGG